MRLSHRRKIAHKQGRWVIRFRASVPQFPYLFPGERCISFGARGDVVMPLPHGNNIPRPYYDNPELSLIRRAAKKVGSRLRALTSKLNHVTCHKINKAG